MRGTAAVLVAVCVVVGASGVRGVAMIMARIVLHVLGVMPERHALARRDRGQALQRQSEREQKRCNEPGHAVRHRRQF